jgi:transposase
VIPAASRPTSSSSARRVLARCPDLDAVADHSGAVEGNVNRIKMLKRQMYGRASFDLPHKRVLLVM